MKTFIGRACLGLLAALPCASVLAQRRGDGGINRAAPPVLYFVVWINADLRNVRLRAADGHTSDVFVPGDVFDVSTLKAGDQVQVDFTVPGKSKNGLSAAGIWPVK